MLQNSLGQPHDEFPPSWWVRDSPVTHPGSGDKRWCQRNIPTCPLSTELFTGDGNSVLGVHDSAQRQRAAPGPPARVFQQEPSCSTPALAIPRL